MRRTASAFLNGYCVGLGTLDESMSRDFLPKCLLDC